MATSRKLIFTNDLRTGYDIIDNEHIELFGKANDLLEACSTGNGKTEVISTMKHLVSYVDYHFNHEDDLMRTHNFPGFESHHAFHNNFREDFMKTASEILLSGVISSSDLMKMKKLTDILVEHIKTGDRLFGLYITNN